MATKLSREYADQWVRLGGGGDACVLPDECYVVCGESIVLRDDRGALGERLGNQHPIERVAVMPRQRCDLRHARLLSVAGELRR